MILNSLGNHLGAGPAMAVAADSAEDAKRKAKLAADTRAAFAAVGKAHIPPEEVAAAEKAALEAKLAEKDAELDRRSKELADKGDKLKELEDKLADTTIKRAPRYPNAEKIRTTVVGEHKAIADRIDALEKIPDKTEAQQEELDNLKEAHKITDPEKLKDFMADNNLGVSSDILDLNEQITQANEAEDNKPSFVDKAWSVAGKAGDVMGAVGKLEDFMKRGQQAMDKKDTEAAKHFAKLDSQLKGIQEQGKSNRDRAMQSAATALDRASQEISQRKNNSSILAALNEGATAGTNTSGKIGGIGSKMVRGSQQPGAMSPRDEELRQKGERDKMMQQQLAQNRQAAQVPKV